MKRDWTTLGMTLLLAAGAGAARGADTDKSARPDAAATGAAPAAPQPGKSMTGPSTAQPSATTEAAAPAEPVIEESAIEIRVYRMIDQASQTVSFPKGQSALTQADRDQLKGFADDVKSSFSVDKLIVAAWADADYPVDASRSLDKAASDLAEARAQHVAQVLKDASALEVDTYQMVKRPNWFQRVFATRGAELKGAVSSRNWLSDAATLEIGRRLRAKGGPGKVVVVARFADDRTAH